MIEPLQVSPTAARSPTEIIDKDVGEQEVDLAPEPPKTDDIVQVFVYSSLLTISRVLYPLPLFRGSITL